MLTCVNCGMAGAVVTGDTIRCAACGHVWTRLDEQGMASYIRASLRRQPLPMIEETETAKTDDSNPKPSRRQSGSSRKRNS